MHERAHERIEDILAKHQSTVPSQRIEALERYVCEKEKALPS
jgi:hypothetical protein